MAINNDLKTIETKLNTLKTNLDGYLTNKGATAGANLTESVNAVDTIQTGGGGGTVKLVDGTKLGSSKFTEVPSNYDFSDIKDWSWMFYRCGNLTTIPLFDMSKVTNMETMLQDCGNLTAIPQLNTEKVENMKSMFSGCYTLTEIPSLNTENVINMERLFENCYTLTEIPSLNTDKVTNMSFMCNNCRMLKKINKLNLIQATNITNMFNVCRELAFINILNLGTKQEVTMFAFQSSTAFGDDTKVAGAKQSLIDSLLINSFDRAAAGYSPCSLRLSPNTKEFLTEEEKTAITAKGYTIA